MGERLEQALAILNGAVGDYLVRTDNGLAIPMSLIHEGRELAAARAELARAYPGASSRVVVLLHGLMCTETIWRFEDGGDFGSHLRRDFGYTPLYLRYNSGRAIADNGRALDELLETLDREYPVEIDEILLLGFSMGGLIARSACHAASIERHGWLARVRRAIYVGTPHQGAPLERAGRVLAKLLHAIPDPYTRLLADLGDLRSDGIKDLGDADLRHEDRARRVARWSIRDPEHPVPLLPSIRHYLVAGTLAVDPRLAALFGDSMVPVPSATGGACADAASIALPPENVRIVHGHLHLDLPRRPEVYEQIQAWCSRTDGAT
jgi:triacylglycerol lipase